MKVKSPTRRSIRRLNIVGVLALLLLVVGFGGWAATTELSGAVIASGQVVVESEEKIVQHPTGGIVGEILVRDGMEVEAGDVLIRLDGTLARSELAIITGRLDELYARKAVVEAERGGLEEVTFPANLTDRADDPEVAAILATSRATFDLRRSAILGQESQLREQIIQLGEEISGLERQVEAKQEEIDLVGPQLENYRRLLQQELIERSQVTALEREEARLEGELGQLVASIATSRGRISELEIQILQIGQEVRSEAAAELQDLTANISELESRRVASEDQLRRLEIRSPQAGVIHELAVHTIGGVIGPGEPLMRVVPVADQLILEARVSPTDRDQISTGQVAALHFAAFNQRTTPRISGEVTSISASTLIDERTQGPYYLIRVSMPADQIALLGDVDVVPGMLATAFIETRPRTVASFLLKPFLDQVDTVFRER